MAKLVAHHDNVGNSTLAKLLQQFMGRLQVAPASQSIAPAKWHDIWALPLRAQDLGDVTDQLDTPEFPIFLLRDLQSRNHMSTESQLLDCRVNASLIQYNVTASASCDEGQQDTVPVVAGKQDEKPDVCVRQPSDLPGDCQLSQGPVLLPGCCCARPGDTQILHSCAALGVCQGAMTKKLQKRIWLANLVYP